MQIEGTNEHEGAEGAAINSEIAMPNIQYHDHMHQYPAPHQQRHYQPRRQWREKNVRGRANYRGRRGADRRQKDLIDYSLIENTGFVAKQLDIIWPIIKHLPRDSQKELIDEIISGIHMQNREHHEEHWTHKPRYTHARKFNMNEFLARRRYVHDSNSYNGYNNYNDNSNYNDYRGRGRGRGGQRQRGSYSYHHNSYNNYKNQRCKQRRGRGGWARGRSGRGSGRGRGGHVMRDRRQFEPFRTLLTEWKLGHYADKLKNEGWDDLQDWGELTENILINDVGFKKGDVKKFYRNYKQWIEKKQVNSNKVNNQKMNSNEMDIVEHKLLEFEKEYGWDKRQRVIFMVQPVIFYGTQSEIITKYDNFVQENIFGGKDQKMIRIMSSGVYIHFVDYVLSQIKSPFQRIHPPHIPTISYPLKLQQQFCDGQNIWLLIAICDIDLKCSNDFGDELVDMKYIHSVKIGIVLFSKPDPNIQKLLKQEGQNDPDEGVYVSGSGVIDSDSDNDNADKWSMKENYNVWDQQKMRLYIKMIGMEKYNKKFKELKITGKDFKSLSDCKYLIVTVGMNGVDAVKFSEVINKRISEYKKVQIEQKKIIQKQKKKKSHVNNPKLNRKK